MCSAIAGLAGALPALDARLQAGVDLPEQNLLEWVDGAACALRFCVQMTAPEGPVGQSSQQQAALLSAVAAPLGSSRRLLWALGSPAERLEPATARWLGRILGSQALCMDQVLKRLGRQGQMLSPTAAALASSLGKDAGEWIEAALRTALVFHQGGASTASPAVIIKRSMIAGGRSAC